MTPFELKHMPKKVDIVKRLRTRGQRSDNDEDANLLDEAAKKIIWCRKERARLKAALADATTELNMDTHG